MSKLNKAGLEHVSPNSRRDQVAFSTHLSYIQVMHMQGVVVGCWWRLLDVLQHLLAGIYEGGVRLDKAAANSGAAGVNEV